jgi:hypothetical protein
MKSLTPIAFIILFLFVNISLTTGQNLLKSYNSTEYTYIYKLDNSSALEIYKRQQILDSAKYFTNLVDSFPNNNPGNYKERLDAGQYITYKAINRTIYFAVLEISNIIVKTNGLNNKNNIYVYDLKGKPIYENIKIFDNKDREINFDSDLKCWTFNNEKSTQQYFYIIYNNALSYHRISRQVFTPVNKTKNRSRTTILPGYFVLNQPSYKKQDSLIFKAFLLKKNGKPYNKTITLKIFDQKARKFALVKKLKPISRGAYSYAMKIPDSFNLDSYYQIYLMSKRNKLLKTKLFRVENYEAKNAKYDARIEKRLFFKGEDVYLHLSCFDANELPLADTKIDINISTSQVTDFFDDSLFMPYEWQTSYWAKEMYSDPSGNTELLLPDSLFLNAKMNFNVRIKFINADGETKTTYLQFQYNPKKERYLFYQKGDSIRAIYLENSQVKPKEARIVSYYDKALEEKTATLPYTFHIQEFPKYYSLFDDTIQMATIRPKRANPNLVHFNGYRSYDSLVLKLENNAGININYWIYQKNKLLHKGRSVEYSLLEKLKGGKSIDIIYSYRLAGEKYTYTQSFHHKEKSLTIETDMPKKIYPGQEVVVKLNVKNHKGKNKKNVNLAAYAINAKVEGIESPDLPYFGKIKTKAYSTFPSYLTPIRINTNKTIDTNYIEWLNLRNTPYYNFTYSKEGYILQYDSIENTSTEFAPYITKNGLFFNISEIYIDKKLIYFDKSYFKAPYSFRVEPGRHNVVLRTASEYLTIKNVEFKQGFKLFIGIEQDSIYKFENIEYVKAESKYLEPEKEQIKKSLLVFTNNMTKAFYLVQGKHILKSSVRYSGRYRRGGYITVGPFKPGKIKIISSQLDTQEFYFQPGFVYQFTDTLISNNKSYNPNLTNNMFGYRSISYMNFQAGMRADTITKPKKKIVPRAKPKLNPYIRNYDISSKLKNHGSLIIKMASKRRIIRTWMINLNDSLNSKFYTYDIKNFGRLASGNYKLVYLSKDSSLYTQNISVLVDGTNYRLYHDTTFQAYDSVFLRKIESLVINLNTPKARDFNNPPKIITNYKSRTYKNKINKTYFKGNILDSNYNPVNNAVVILEKKGIFVRGAYTNEAGSFIFYDSLGGEYQLKIHTQYKTYNYYKTFIVKHMTNDVNIILPDVLMRNYYNGYYAGDDVLTKESDASYTANGSYNSNIYTTDEIALSATPTQLESISINKVSNMFGKINIERKDKKEDKFIDGVSIAMDSITQNEMQRFENIKSNAKANKIRSEFRDYGFFVPNILTNRKGEATFTVQFPDNQTMWKTFFPAIDYKKNTGLLELDIQAYKPLSATIALPSFLIQGDVCNVNGKISNYIGEPIELTPWYKTGSDSISLTKTSPKHFQVFSKDITFDKIGKAELTFGFSTTDGYLDAERRNIPILVNGIEVSTSNHFYAKNNFQINYKPDNNILSRKLFITNNQLDVLEEEIEYLKNYSYGCNEQNASKIRALLAEKSIKTALDLPFKDEKALRKIIYKLEKTQNADGSWGWWNRGDKAEVWMTIYIADALNLAIKSGYSTSSIYKALNFLEGSLSKMNISNQLYAIDILCNFRNPNKYKNYIEKANKLNLSLTDKFRLISIKQKSKLPYNIQDVILSANKDKYGVYWGENVLDFKINIVQTSSLAYNILKYEPNNNIVMLEETRNYFLSHLSKNRNTIERAMLLQDITDDIIAKNNIKSEIRSELKINGKVMKQEYPILLNFNNTEGIYIEKTGAPLQISVYETSIQNPENKVDTLFAISSVFRKGRDTISSVKLGENFQHYGNFFVKKKTEFAMLEIPIPAGAVYVNKFKTKLPYETERQYQKDKVVIFFRNLPYGNYYFNIDLQSRFAGKYNVVPSKISLMYFPDVFNFSNSENFEIIK